MFVMHLLRRASRTGHRLATQLVALIVLVALLSGGAVGVLVTDRARQALRENILHSSLAAADLAANIAAGYMSGAEAEARDLAGTLELETAAAHGDWEVATPQLEAWLPQHPNVVGVGLVDLQGVTRVTGNGDKTNVGQPLNAGSDWFTSVRVSGQPFLGAPSMSSLTRRPRMPYGVPVVDDTGTLRAVMVVSISLEAMSDTITAVQVAPS